MLKEKLAKFKKKRITLDELYSMNASAEEIHRLVGLGMLVPVKSSGTDGNLRDPLHKKYTIVSENEDYSEIISQIHKLHPKLIANGYLLKKPDSYIKYKELFDRISLFLESNAEIYPISRRERSFSIFGDEKILDNNISLINSLGLSETDLGFYTTPELCFPDYIPERKPQMSLIICENKDIWFNIRRLMTENRASELFGVHIDGVVFGQGNDITGKEKFTSYARFLGGKDIHFLYCGDIDRAGFDIFFRLTAEASNLDIQLFIPIYRKMLELADIDKLPDSEDNRQLNVKWDKILHIFSETETQKLKEVLEGNKRLPQEIINYTVLKENMR